MGPRSAHGADEEPSVFELEGSYRFHLMQLDAFSLDNNERWNTQKEYGTHRLRVRPRVHLGARVSIEAEGDLWASSSTTCTASEEVPPLFEAGASAAAEGAGSSPVTQQRSHSLETQ